METLFLWIAALLTWFESVDNTASEETPKVVQTAAAFSDIGLRTNTSIHSIPLEEVLGGGPIKDGIPALLNPNHWDTNAQAQEWLNPEHLGVLYEYKGIKKFYPYDLLYWHEIVNDRIGDHHFAVTFCPLCGSVVVYDREILPESEGSQGGIREFGVSGKLWESNLLMYDKQTETLWSQIQGEAVVGDLTGKKLEVLNSHLMSFADLSEHHPSAQVLNRETGFKRSYGASPYGNYEANETLIFPVKKLEKTFHPKEIFYVVDYKDKSVGFHLKDLKNKGQVHFYVGTEKLLAEFTPTKEIYVSTSEGGIVPGYYTMWFSWMTHQDKLKHFWSDQELGINTVDDPV